MTEIQIIYGKNEKCWFNVNHWINEQIKVITLWLQLTDHFHYLFMLCHNISWSALHIIWLYLWPSAKLAFVIWQHSLPFNDPALNLTMNLKPRMIPPHRGTPFLSSHSLISHTFLSLIVITLRWVFLCGVTAIGLGWEAAYCDTSLKYQLQPRP